MAVWLLAFILAAVAVQWVTRLAAERFVREWLGEAAASVCAMVDPEHPPGIVADIAARSVRISDLRLLPSIACADASLRVEGRITTARVNGLSLIGLLFRDRAIMSELQVEIAEARITMRPDSLQEVSNDESRKDPQAWSFEIGSFDVAVHSATVVAPNGDTLRANGKGVEAEGRDVRFVTGQEKPLRFIRGETIRITADSISGIMANGYDWATNHIAFDQAQGTLGMAGMSIAPSLGLEAFSSALNHEADVVEARLDTLRISGFDLSKGLAQGAWTMRSIRVASGAITVLRDKLAVDGNDSARSLPSRLLRSLPLGSGADSIVVARLAVQYRERVDRQRGYAVIPFTRIHATITGANHSGGDTSALIVRARAVVFDTSSISILLRAVVADTTDRFELEAAISPMPFAAVNQATGPLLDIQATEGWIDSVNYRMTADDRHASGAVRMRHHGLKLIMGGRQRAESANQLKSILLNSVVRNKDTNRSGDARDGRFDFERRRDRLIFNYLWSGLREGVKAELLPDLLNLTPVETSDGPG